MERLHDSVEAELIHPHRNQAHSTIKQLSHNLAVLRSQVIAHGFVDSAGIKPLMDKARQIESHLSIFNPIVHASADVSDLSQKSDHEVTVAATKFHQLKRKFDTLPQQHKTKSIEWIIDTLAKRLQYHERAVHPKDGDMTTIVELEGEMQDWLFDQMVPSWSEDMPVEERTIGPLVDSILTASDGTFGSRSLNQMKKNLANYQAKLLSGKDDFSGDIQADIHAIISETKGDMEKAIARHEYVLKERERIEDIPPRRRTTPENKRYAEGRLAQLQDELYDVSKLLRDIAARKGYDDYKSIKWADLGDKSVVNRQAGRLLKRTLVDGASLAQKKDDRFLLLELPDNITLKSGQRVTRKSLGLNRLPHTVDPDSRRHDTFESHVAQRGYASQSSSDAASVQRDVNGLGSHQHQHAAFVRKRFMELATAMYGKELASFVALDNLRIDNLVHEFDLVSKGVRLAGNGNMFDFLKPFMFRPVFKTLEETTDPRQLAKTAAVVFREEGIILHGGEKDARPIAGINSIETRTIDRRREAIPVSEKSWLERNLNATQRVWTTAALHLDPKRLKRWHQKRSLKWKASQPTDSDIQIAILRELHYNDGQHKFVRSRISPKLKDKFLEKEYFGKLSTFKTILSRFDEKPSHERDYALFMLIHDWSQDTMWINLPKSEQKEAKERVLKAQTTAILDIIDHDAIKDEERREHEIRETMKDFITFSKLKYYAELAKGTVLK